MHTNLLGAIVSYRSHKGTVRGVYVEPAPDGIAQVFLLIERGGALEKINILDAQIEDDVLNGWTVLDQLSAIHDRLQEIAQSR